MTNILDYVSWRGDLSFEADKFNCVDALVLSQVCYMDFTDVISPYPSIEKKLLKNVIESVFLNTPKEKIILGLILPKEIISLTENLMYKDRYANIYVSNYVNFIDKNNSGQFSALCYHLDDKNIYISFRGTDDTLIGWQENLHMLNQFPIPSQKLASKYINKIIKLFPNCNFYIGGHSKGGNLAAYSAIYCTDTNKKFIKKVYCFDSPGFKQATINIERYELVKDKIFNILPNQAIIGMIFTPFGGNTIIVESKYKGIRQHDAFSWAIENKCFVTVDDLADNAKKFDKTMKSVLSNLSDEQINDLAKNIYLFLNELGKDTLIEVQKDYIRFVKLLNRITPSNRKLFATLIYNLFKYKLL